MVYRCAAGPDLANYTIEIVSRKPTTVMCRLAVFFACLLALAGCSSDTPEIDPLTGLSPVLSTAAPLDAPVRVERPVALVPSENSAKELAGYDKFMAESPVTRALVPADILKSGDPRSFINATVAVLRRRFGDLVLVDDLATARRRGFRTALVLDLRSHHLVSAFDENRATITVVVLADSRQPVSRIVAQGTSRTTYGSMDPHWNEAVNMAVANLEAKVSALLP